MIMKILLLATEQAINPTNWEKLVSFLAHDAFRNTLALGTLILAVIASLRALAQSKESKRLKSAEYLDKLTEKIRSDDDIVYVLNLIEYNKFEYGWDFHESEELEHQVDKTLSFFSKICYLKKKKILSPDEFRFFDYEVTRIFQNKDMVDYLYNLYHFSQKQNRPISFCYLVEYGLENGLLDKDFTDRNACKGMNPSYKYVLNI